MYQQRIAYLGVLAVAVVAVACGPNDAGIGTKVKSNLTSDETVKAAQIDIGVEKKVVTLSGAVDTPAVKEQAVAVARRTAGVTDVVDQITVREQGTGSTPGPGFGREMMEKGMKVRSASVRVPAPGGGRRRSSIVGRLACGRSVGSSPTVGGSASGCLTPALSTPVRNSQR